MLLYVVGIASLQGNEFSNHCLLLQVPFHLVLRLWDIYILEGERLLVTMSFNIMKLHRS